MSSVVPEKNAKFFLIDPNFFDEKLKKKLTDKANKTIDKVTESCKASMGKPSHPSIESTGKSSKIVSKGSIVVSVKTMNCLTDGLDECLKDYAKSNLPIMRNEWVQPISGPGYYRSVIDVEATKKHRIWQEELRAAGKL